ncbi:MAG: hypothetical protein NTX02_08180 [Planctomycetia bacterium]|nr:hypothetical protein [Planctomycetia bacterium]
MLSEADFIRLFSFVPKLFLALGTGMAQGFYVAAVPLHGGRIHNRLDRSFIHQRALT